MAIDPRGLRQCPYQAGCRGIGSRDEAGEVFGDAATYRPSHYFCVRGSHYYCLGYGGDVGDARVIAGGAVAVMAEGLLGFRGVSLQTE